MRLVLVFFLFSSVCGGTYHVTSDPVEVNHNININFEQIALYCQDICKNDEVPVTCQENCYTNIVTAIMQEIHK